jgi:tetratricopeptide (TPR) repeat protein
MLIAGAHAQAADPEQARSMAASLYSAGNPDAAIALLRDFVQQHPSEISSRIDLARYYLYRKQYDNAAAECNEVLRRQPGSLPAKLGLAKVASWQGDFDKALEIYDEILRRSPSFYDARVGKGFTLTWMGRNEEAYALLNAAAKSHPNDAETVAESERLSRLLRKQEQRVAETPVSHRVIAPTIKKPSPLASAPSKPKPESAMDYPRTFAEPVAPAVALPQEERPIWPWLFSALVLMYSGFFIAYRQLKKTATASVPKPAVQDEPKGALRQKQEVATGTLPSDPEQSGPRVLIAEEAPEIADFLRMVFAQFGASSIDHLEPERAIECLGSGNFDLCVLPTSCAAQLGVAQDEGTVPQDALRAVVFSSVDKEEGERIAGTFGCRYLTKPLRVAAVAALLQPEISVEDPLLKPRRSYSVDREIYMPPTSVESGSPAGHD